VKGSLIALVIFEISRDQAKNNEREIKVIKGRNIEPDTIKKDVEKFLCGEGSEIICIK
jgi:hypothetical protein